jgi:hypothetical protein
MNPLLPCLYPKLPVLQEKKKDLEKEKDKFRQLLLQLSNPIWANIPNLAPTSQINQDSDEEEEDDL